MATHEGSPYGSTARELADVRAVLGVGGVSRRRYWTPAQAEPVKFEFWPCRRPLTATWGSDTVWKKICASFGQPDAAFGKTDGIPDDMYVTAIDRENGYEWARLPFADSRFMFGYWDPPYDRLYKREGQEIWRTVRRLAILHTHIWPRAWLMGATREAMVAITMGPLKQIRCLQVFGKRAEVTPNPPDRPGGALMTVGELIERLREYPDYYVIVLGDKNCDVFVERATIYGPVGHTTTAVRLARVSTLKRKRPRAEAR